MPWLEVFLPELAIDAISSVESASGRGHANLMVVIEAGLVVAATKDAKEAGAHIGTTLAAASSWAAGLISVNRKPLLEAALMQRLAMTLSRFTPWLAVRPDSIGLDLSSTERLFGGIGRATRQIESAARQAGAASVELALASTPKAAAILARGNRDQVSPRSPTNGQRARLGVDMHALTHKRLDCLPVSALQPVWTIPVPLLDLLQGIGCRTLADLRALPRRGLTRRGGRELLDLVARAYGDEPDPQTWYEPPPRFELGLELMHRADNAAALVFAAQRLVQPLTGWLARHWLAASRLSLVMRHETSQRHDRHDRRESRLDIALAEASRDAEQIMLLLRERLQRMELPAPVYAIVLRLDDAVSHAGRDTALWASAATQRASERALIDRLSARLGSERVQRLQSVADHRPERATRYVSAQSLVEPDSAASAGRDAYSTSSPDAATPIAAPIAPRPIWMLADPLPLREARGRPVHQGKPLALISRAERIEYGWFDGALVSRDYHVAASDNACWWIYRERHGGQPSRWYLHGIFG